MVCTGPETEVTGSKENASLVGFDGCRTRKTKFLLKRQNRRKVDLVTVRVRRSTNYKIQTHVLSDPITQRRTVRASTGR